MPPRRPPRPTPPDVEVLRSALVQGKSVRVGIAPSGQFPDGVTGRVRRIGDPAVDGDEFIFVEIPVGGTKDVLPFAAADLIGAPVRRTAVAAQAARAGDRPEAAPAGDRPVAAPALAVPSGRSKPGAATGPEREPTPAPTGRATRPPGSARGRRPAVTITISTAGDESASWRVDAKIGARTAVRPTPVPPARVLEIVESLGDPKLTEVVKALLEDHRRSTQARADALAAELSSLRAELSLFPPGGVP